MCEETKTKIQGQKMPQSIKRAFKYTLDEISNVYKIQKEYSKQLEDLNKRLIEMLGLVRGVYDKVNIDKFEEQVATITLLKKVFSSRFAQIVFIIILTGLVAIGISVVYILENASSVAQIVGSVK